MEKLKNSWKKFLKNLQFRDYLWSIPLSFVVYYFVGYEMEKYLDASFYDSGWYHRGLLAASLLILSTGIVNLGIWFNHRGVMRYYYDKTSGVKEDFKELPKWLKVLYFPLLFFLFLVVFVWIFHELKP
jgi:ABC-type Fe3+ transport system permease subunit